MRPRNLAWRRSFKPLFDVLEDRIQPSTAIIAPGPIAPPVGGSNSPFTVSTQQLDVTRGAAPASFTVVLNGQPSAEVDLTIAEYDPNAASDGTTVSVADPHLAFTTGDWNTPQAVDVSSPTGSTPMPTAFVQLFGIAISSDPNFDAQAMPPISVQVSDPVPTGGITLSTTQLQVVPGGASATYTMVLNSQPAADVTVVVTQVTPVLDPLPGPVLVSGGVANPVVDVGPLTITSQTLTFTADDWNTPQTIAVSDQVLSQAAYYDRVVLLVSTVTSDDPNYNGISVTPVTVAVAPSAGCIVVSTQSLTVTTGGPSVTYTIALGSQPAADVTVAINQFSPIVDPPGPIGPVTMTGAAANAIVIGGIGTTLAISPQTLTFTAGDWNTPQTVTVSAPAGSVGPYGGFVLLSDTVTSDDPSYNGIAAPAVAVQIQNNPTYSLVFSTDQVTLALGASSTYTIALASAPAQDVTVAISVGPGLFLPQPVVIGPIAVPPILIGGSTVTVAPQSLTFTPDNWNTPQPVTVSASASTDGSPIIPYDQLTYAVTSADANWNNIAVPPTSVLVSSASSTGGTGPTHSANATPIATHTTLSAPAVAVVGQSVTLTAHVTARSPDADSPSGAVVFMNGKTSLGSADVTNGTATLTVTTLGVGSHNLAAAFTSSDATESNSKSATIHTVVRKAATQTTLQVSVTPASADAPASVTLTVQVALVVPGTLPLNGTITFMNGNHVLGTAQVTNGVASLTVTGLALGKHRFTARYAATAETLASVAPPVVASIQ